MCIGNTSGLEGPRALLMFVWVQGGVLLEGPYTFVSNRQGLCKEGPNPFPRDSGLDSASRVLK